MGEDLHPPWADTQGRRRRATARQAGRRALRAARQPLSSMLCLSASSAFARCLFAWRLTRIFSHGNDRMSAPMPRPHALLEVRSLRFEGHGRPVFDGLSFDLPTGLSLVTGEEGSGKSTLLRLLAGDLSAHAGHMVLADSPLTPHDAAWREQVFWIDPNTQAHDASRADDYLSSLHRQYPRCSSDALADLVAGFELQPHLAKPLHMLSTGSKRKVWLAAAFAAGARLTLIDQPFAALDGPATRFLRECLHDVADHPSRGWLIADHAPPPGVPLASTLRL